MEFGYKNNIISVIISISVLCVVVAKRDFVILFKAVECNSNAEYMELNCTLRPTSDIPFIDFQANVNKTYYEFYVTFAIILVRNNKDKFTLLNTTAINVCESRKKSNIENLASIIIDELRKFGNFTMDCPIEVGYYQVTGFQMNPDLFPPYFPESSFIAESYFFTKKDKKLIQISHFWSKGAITKRRRLKGRKPTSFIRKNIFKL